MKNKWLVLLMAAAVLTAAPLYAHHPFVPSDYEDRTQSIEGDLVQFLLRNPHSFVYLEAPDEKGHLQRFAVEWASSLQLSRQGVTRETLKAGDHLIITGNLGRNPEDHRVRLRTIVRPKDGWHWGGTL